MQHPNIKVLIQISAVQKAERTTHILYKLWNYHRYKEENLLKLDNKTYKRETNIMKHESKNKETKQNMNNNNVIAALH